VSNNQHIEARNNLAATFMHFDRYENALQHYSVLLDDDPINIEYLYNCGVAQMALGHLSQAQSCFHKILHQAPTHFSSLNNLAAIAIRLEHRDEAVNLLQQAINANPNDTISQHMLSALQGNQHDQKTCPDYARNLFNNYALYYDKHLREILYYQVPEQIVQLLQENNINKVEKTLDLGCGSGLSGEALKNITTVLNGVDISKKMLAQARQKDIYDTLTEQEINDYLLREQSYYALIVAADVLPYFGCLSKLIQLMGQRLEEDGHIVVSFEKNNESPWLLQGNGRFSHQTEYVAKLAHHFQLQIIQCKTVKGRTQAQRPIMIDLMLLKKNKQVINSFKATASKGTK